jgi:hypothetical protein
MPDKFTILRLTLKVDMDDIKERSFVRAVLRRVNVLFAKARPKGGLAEILNGSRLCDAYEGKQVVGQTTKKAEKQRKCGERKALTFRGVKPAEKSKPETIVEQSMEPPVIEAEIVEG